MYFSELLTKITLGTQNQTPSEAQLKAGADIAKRAQRHKELEDQREQEIVCRIVNGNKVKKRKYQKDEKGQQEEVTE